MEIKDNNFEKPSYISDEEARCLEDDPKKLDDYFKHKSNSTINVLDFIFKLIRGRK